MRKQMRHVQVKTVQEFLVIPKTEAARLLLYSEKRLAFCLSYSIGSCKTYPSGHLPPVGVKAIDMEEYPLALEDSVL